MVMETVFIINPKAGKRNDTDRLLGEIKKAAEQTDASVTTYITKCVGDATRFVSEFCRKCGKTRFIACGGDGTLNEVLNGIKDCEAAEVGVLPMGTGNDFCRNFRELGDFENISLQITGECVKSDVISYTTVVDGEIKEGCCVNMFNIGFDCSVADLTGTIKKRTFFSGSLAYFISILITLVRKRCTRLKIELDGRECHRGKVLLTSIANGCFCGGGIKSNPLAEANDGLININIIKNVSRLRFISLLPYYMKGTFLKLKGIDKVIASEKCSEVVITPECGKIRLCIDGEIVDAGKTRFKALHNAFNFVIPAKTAKREAIREYVIPCNGQHIQ